jgi:hypothetical protein
VNEHVVVGADERGDEARDLSHLLVDEFVVRQRETQVDASCWHRWRPSKVPVLEIHDRVDTDARVLGRRQDLCPDEEPRATSKICISQSGGGVGASLGISSMVRRAANRLFAARDGSVLLDR